MRIVCAAERPFRSILTVTFVISRIIHRPGLSPFSASEMVWLRQSARHSSLLTSDEDSHSIFILHVRSNFSSFCFGGHRLALVLHIPGRFAQALRCDCAASSRVLPLLVPGVVQRGAVFGISHLDVRISHSVVSRRGCSLSGSCLDSRKAQAQ